MPIKVDRILKWGDSIPVLAVNQRSIFQEIADSVSMTFTAGYMESGSSIKVRTAEPYTSILKGFKS